MKIPQRILDIHDKFGDFMNHTLYYKGGSLDIRVMDVFIALGLVFCIVYYWYRQGPFAALQGGVLYIFMSMCIYYFFPSSKEMK